MITAVVVIFAAVLAVHAQIARPAQGYEMGNVTAGFDVILPLSIVQCEPVLVYYNITGTAPYNLSMVLIGSDNSRLLSLDIPPFVGYLDWICNIPAGYIFFASFFLAQTYTVQPGSSSACLGNVTTTYSYVHYGTNFQSATQLPESGSHPNYQL